MKAEINDAFKPMLESMIDGNTIRKISDALNLHLLRTLKTKKPVKPKEQNNPENLSNNPIG